MSKHASYPESAMNTAVHMGAGVVRVYGHEHQGFRPFQFSAQCETEPAAITYCEQYNEEQRRKLGIKIVS